MKKRLFCLLVVVAMLGSSITAYAIEPEERVTTEGEDSEKGTDGGGVKTRRQKKHLMLFLKPTKRRLRCRKGQRHLM